MSTELEMTQSLVEKYQTDGYEVTINPNPILIPFDLEGYRPDLLAIKDEIKLIIEIKSGGKKLSLEIFQRVAELISEHKQDGWRFILVTASDEQDSDEIDTEKSYLTWQEIAEQIRQAPSLINMIGNNAALLYLWGICEAVLRRYTFEQAIPVERQPFSNLANCLYDIGELSISDRNTLLAIRKQRNKVAHGFKVNISRETLEQLIDFIKKILAERTTVAS